MEVSQEVRRWLDYELRVTDSGKPRVSVVYSDLETQLDFIRSQTDRKLDAQLFNEKKEWAESEQQKRDYEAFYRDALPYSHKDLPRFPLQRARVLAKHYTKFSSDGKQPLINKRGNLSSGVLSKNNPFAYVGFVFHKVLRGVKKDLGYL